MEKIKCSRCKGTGIDPVLENNQSCKKCSGLKKLDWIQNITGVELSRMDKTLLFVIQALNKFAELGLMTDGGLKVDDRAKEVIKDFKPTEKEIEIATLTLKKQGYIG